MKPIHGMQTNSITECEPSPMVVLIAAAPSSPRSVTRVGGAELKGQILPRAM